MGQMAFGTDFGMLRAGHDEAGVWHLLDKGAMFVPIPYMRAFLRVLTSTHLTGPSH